MWPATAWDNEVNMPNPAQVWTVMSRVRERQRRLRLGADITQSVLAFMFAPPDSDAMQMLDARGEYFDIRTGDTWDLFFPGYYRSLRDIPGGSPVGHRFGSAWHFQSAGFDYLRWHIEDSSEDRWRYSGDTDLVLVNVFFPKRGEPTVDWQSTISGQVTDTRAGIRTLTLANIIERITRDLEGAMEDPHYGVGDVTDRTHTASDHTAVRDFMINALGGIAAALGVRAMGM